MNRKSHIFDTVELFVEFQLKTLKPTSSFTRREKKLYEWRHRESSPKSVNLTEDTADHFNYAIKRFSRVIYDGSKYFRLGRKAAGCVQWKRIFLLIYGFTKWPAPSTCCYCLNSFLRSRWKLQSAALERSLIKLISYGLRVNQPDPLKCRIPRRPQKRKSEQIAKRSRSERWILIHSHAASPICSLLWGFNCLHPAPWP